MQFTDTVTVAGTRRTEDGYLVAAPCAVWPFRHAMPATQLLRLPCNQAA